MKVSKSRGFASLRAYWRARNPHLGRRVQLSSSNTKASIVGTFRDLSPEGHPIITHPNGATTHITSSNYSMRLME